MMSNDAQTYQRFNMAQSPDRDHTQRELQKDFIVAMLLRGDTTPDDIVVSFGRQYAGVLKWLGDVRQDDMLREAMKQCDVDLSHWINKESEA